MAQAFSFNHRVHPRGHSPVFAPPVDRSAVRRIFESLGEKSLEHTGGSFEDKDRKVGLLLDELAPLLGERLIDRLIRLSFFLTPINITVPWTWPAERIVTTPPVVYDVEHTHATDLQLTAGELVAHSAKEGSGMIKVSLVEETYILIASILRRMGLQANLALLRESPSGNLTSCLCIYDPRDYELFSFVLPEHPAFNQIMIFTDTEMLGLTLALTALNHIKKVRDIGRDGMHLKLPSQAVIREFNEADSLLFRGRVLIDHPVLTVIGGIRGELEVLKQEILGNRNAVKLE